MQKLNFCKRIFLPVVVYSLLAISNVTHADALTLGGVASNVTEAMSSLAQLITAASYVAGFGFAAAGILKFKAHKDNPTQIPLGTPVALVFVGAALIFLPTIFSIAGQTLFGATTGIGGVTGTTGF